MTSQRGNALFLVLMAVGLIAALSYAVTQSSRGSTSMDRENIDMVVSELLQQNTRIEYALKKFLLVNEYDISEIDLYDANKGLNGDLNACTSDKCNLFHPSGGGITAPLLPEGAFDPSPTSCLGNSYNGHYKYHIRITSVEDIGSTLPDILLIYNCIRDDVCDQINYKMNVLSPGDADILHAKGSFGTDYASFNSSTEFTNLTPNFIGSLDARAAGQKIFCEKEQSILT